MSTAPCSLPISRRSIVTLATGPHVELLEIARPSMEDFADRYGYDLVVADVKSTRPPSWWKVPALRSALDEYDEVLWIDADVVLFDRERDLDVPAGFWQAMVRHHTGCGEVPNCGVWFVRRQMKPFLERMWSMTEHLDHGWWEQAAMLDLLGYRHEPRPSLLVEPTKLYERTFWLDHGWNTHPNDAPQPAHPRFLHATMYLDRPGVMRQWAAGNLVTATS